MQARSGCTCCGVVLAAANNSFASHLNGPQNTKTRFSPPAIQAPLADDDFWAVGVRAYMRFAQYVMDVRGLHVRTCGQ